MDNELLLQQVSAALDGDDFATAIALSTRAIKAAPRDPTPQHCRGVVHALAAQASADDKKRRKSLRAAVVDLERAIVLLPTWAEAHLNLGLARLQLDEADFAVDLSRALDLGLEPVLALQAHSRRGRAGDLDIVNALRKTRGVGQAWRSGGPQRVTLRAPGAQGRVKREQPPPAVQKRGAKAARIDWVALNRRAEAAWKSAVRASATGQGGPSPHEARLAVWLEGFPAPLHEAIRVFFAEPPSAAPWKAACKLAGRGNEVALARALVGRQHAPFLPTRDYLLQAAAALRDDEEGLSRVVDDFLRELERLSNFRAGQDEMLAKLQAIVPPRVVSTRARALIATLSGGKKYAPLAPRLRAWLA